MTASTPDLVDAGTVVPARPETSGDRSLVLIRRIGWAVFACQLVGLVIWSTILWHRYALTWDFGVYFLGWHSYWVHHLNPLNPTALRFVLDNNAILIEWPLAVLTRIYPHGVVLLWVQDLATAATGLVAFRWMADIIESRIGDQKTSAWILAGAALVLLVANPWIYWSDSFDIHSEMIAVLFLVLALRALIEKRWRALALWSVLILTCGYVAASYVIALGVTAIILRGGRWRAGIALGVGGFVTLRVMTGSSVVPGSADFLVGNYGYLVGNPRHLSAEGLVLGLMTRPGRVISTLWLRRADLWANFAPSGLIGLASPAVIVLLVAVAVPNTLAPNFSPPLFQSVVVYVLGPVGTILVLTAAMHRWPQWRRWAVGTGAAVAALCVAWGVLWLPHLRQTWLRVTPSQAALLSKVDAMIPIHTEVAASQGVGGRFADRDHWVGITAADPVPVQSADMWFVIAPTVGIENEPTVQADAQIARLAGPMGATLEVADDGIWVFHWRPPPGLKSVVFSYAPNLVPAWATPGPQGRQELFGPLAQWFVAGTQAPGYVVARDYWPLAAGPYVASITWRGVAPVNFEVWDESANLLIGRRSLAPVSQTTTVDLAFAVPSGLHTSAYVGFNPFKLPPLQQQTDQMEIRVWSPGGQTAVYTLGIRPGPG